MKTKLIGICVMSFTLLTGAPAQADTTPDYAQLVEQAHAKYKNLNDGKVADYIPALASYDPKNLPSCSRPLTAKSTRPVM